VGVSGRALESASEGGQRASIDGVVDGFADPDVAEKGPVLSAPVTASKRVNRSVDGATQIAFPRSATAPGPSGITLPIRRAPR
jgi:hypothetical protein